MHYSPTFCYASNIWNESVHFSSKKTAVLGNRACGFLVNTKKFHSEKKWRWNLSIWRMGARSNICWWLVVLSKRGNFWTEVRTRLSKKGTFWPEVRAVLSDSIIEITAPWPSFLPHLCCWANVPCYSGCMNLEFVSADHQKLGTAYAKGINTSTFISRDTTPYCHLINLLNIPEH